MSNIKRESELEGESLCVISYVQALPVAINEGLEQWFVVGDGLQYVGVIGHIADGPLAQPRTTQSEDVTVRVRRKKRERDRDRERGAWFTHTNCKPNFRNK